MTKVEAKKTELAAIEREIAALEAEPDYRAFLHAQEVKKKLDSAKTRLYDCRSALRCEEYAARPPVSPLILDAIDQLDAEWLRVGKLVETNGGAEERGRFGIGGG